MTIKNCYSLTLVLPKADKAVAAQLADICAHIDSISILDTRELSPHKAIDLTLADPKPSARTDIEAALAAHNVAADFCFQVSKTRKKRLLICDMDSTLIGQECIDELADFAGVKDRVSRITERAMRGELDFEEALKERVGLLKDLPLSNLQTCFDQRIHLNTGAKTLARTMSAHGAKTVIVSGGFTFFTARIAQQAGFDTHQANILLDNGSTLTGEVAMPILGRDAKKAALMEHSAGLGGPETAVGIGDGANDLAMIEACGLGIAYKAKPIVAAAASCAIDHTDLTSALYYQGYADTDFV
jgi:phosphoserine phosphatase